MNENKIQFSQSDYLRLKNNIIRKDQIRAVVKLESGSNYNSTIYLFNTPNVRAGDTAINYCNVEETVEEIYQRL